MKFSRHLYKLVEWQMNAGIWNGLNMKSQNCTSKWQEFKKNTVTAGWINQLKLKHSFNLSVEIFFLKRGIPWGKRVQVSTFTSYHLWKQNMLRIYSYTLYITHDHFFFFNTRRPVVWAPDAVIIPPLGRPRAFLSKKSLQQKNVPASEVGFHEDASWFWLVLFLHGASKISTVSSCLASAPGHYLPMARQGFSCCFWGRRKGLVFLYVSYESESLELSFPGFPSEELPSELGG